jgi:hypothetical protein
VKTLRRRLLACALVGWGLVAFTPPALGQGGEPAAERPLAPPARDAAVEAEADGGALTTRPGAKGPSLRERGGRTRRASPASGVLFVAIIVGAIGYYVLKRLRR